MVIYIDLLIILNLIYDYLILKVVSIVLKRNTNNKRLFLASLVGEISILFLVFNFNYILLLISKIVLAIIMNIIAFKQKGLRYLLVNLSFFYMLSIILGGFIYYLHIHGINYLCIICLIPIVFTVYIIQHNKRNNLQNYYDAVITFNNNHKIKVVSYLDTGNNIVDPISLKPVIIVNKKLCENNYKKFIYVNIKVLNHTSLLKCIKVKSIELNNHIIKNVLIGLSDDEIKIDGVDCILNNKLRKEIEI